MKKIGKDEFNNLFIGRTITAIDKINKTISFDNGMVLEFNCEGGKDGFEKSEYDFYYCEAKKVPASSEFVPITIEECDWNSGVVDVYYDDPTVGPDLEMAGQVNFIGAQGNLNVEFQKNVYQDNKGKWNPTTDSRLYFTVITKTGDKNDYLLIDYVAADEPRYVEVKEKEEWTKLYDKFADSDAAIEIIKKAEEYSKIVPGAILNMRLTDFLTYDCMLFTFHDKLGSLDYFPIMTFVIDDNFEVTSIDDYYEYWKDLGSKKDDK